MDKPKGLYLRREKKIDMWYCDVRFMGKRVRRLLGPSRKGAEKFLSKIRTEIAENRWLDRKPTEKPISFHDFAVQYVAGCQANWKGGPGGRLSHLRRLEQELGARYLHEITPWSIEKYKAKRKGEVKPASVNRSLALLKHFLNKAIEWGKLKGENPSKKVKLLKGEVKRTRWLIAEEIQTLLANCDERVLPLVLIALNTGMRAGEIVSLRRDMVDFENKIIMLTDTKNQEARHVPLNETVLAVLRSIKVDGGDGRFFPGGYTRIKRWFGKAVVAAGITDCRFHDLRHTFASHLVMKGTDLNTVRELLGHKSMAMTLRYAHLGKNLKAKAVETLDTIMSPVSPQKSEAKKVVSLSVGNR